MKQKKIVLWGAGHIAAAHAALLQCPGEFVAWAPAQLGLAAGGMGLIKRSALRARGVRA